MKNKNTLLYILGSFLIGLILGGAYVSNYGTFLPFQGTGQVSKADYMLEESGDLGDCGLIGYPNCNCTYTRSGGKGIAYGTVVPRGDRYVCQSSSGYTRNFNLQ